MSTRSDEQDIYDNVKAPITNAVTSGLMGVQMRLNNQIRSEQQQAADNRRLAQMDRTRIQALVSMDRAELEKVFREDWLDNASIREISSTYAMAHASSGRDPRIGEAEERIARLVRERYGIDPSRMRDAEELERTLSAIRETGDTRETQGAHPDEVGVRTESGGFDQRSEVRNDSRRASSDIPAHVSENETAHADMERMRREVRRLRELGLSDVQAEDAARVQLGNARPVNEAARAGAAGARTHTAASRRTPEKTMGKTRGIAR